MKQLKQNALTADRYLNCINLQLQSPAYFGSSKRLCIKTNSGRKCICKTYTFKTLCKMMVMYKQQLQLLVNDQRDTQIPFYIFIYNSLHVSST